MVKDSQPWEPKDTEKLGAFLLQCYEVTVACPKCHHSRTLGNLYIQRRIGIATTVGRLKERLRCHQCDTRGGIVTVVRLPR
jgi:hypothetical protein